jgi:RecA/RadA recombinase
MSIRDGSRCRVTHFDGTQKSVWSAVELLATLAQQRLLATSFFCWSCDQLRMKIGVFYGNPETTTGGNALKFYASVRLDIRKTGVVKNGDVVMGTKTRARP